MDQTSSWPPPLTPPSLPAQVWQRQGSSLSVRAQHDVDYSMREPQAAPQTPTQLPARAPHDVDHGMLEPQPAPQTPTQKLVAGLDPAKIQEVAASQVAISEMYYETSLQHAQRLFRWALITAGAGLIFFLVAVALQVLQKPVNGALISLTSGGVLAVLAMLNFILYGRVFNQLRAFHERLDRTQQYMLANSICENLKGDVKQATQIELIRAMMHSLALREEKTEKGTAK
jgi:TRADD-N domain-containing protein